MRQVDLRQKFSRMAIKPFGIWFLRGPILGGPGHGHSHFPDKGTGEAHSPAKVEDRSEDPPDRVDPLLRCCRALRPGRNAYLVIGL